MTDINEAQRGWTECSMARTVAPNDTADNHWEFNEHLCGDGPINAYPRNNVYHIAEPPFYADRERDPEEWQIDEEVSQ